MNLSQIISNEIKQKTLNSFKFKLLNVNEELHSAPNNSNIDK